MLLVGYLITDSSYEVTHLSHIKQYIPNNVLNK